jgi:hypothetical protein
MLTTICKPRWPSQKLPLPTTAAVSSSAMSREKGERPVEKPRASSTLQQDVHDEIMVLDHDEIMVLDHTGVL